MITLPNDFEGFYNIAQDCYSIKDLELYIEQFEPEYLCKILGKDLSEALINELETNGGVLPPSSRFVILFEPMCLGCNAVSCCCKKKSADVGYSIGLKKILLGLIYYDYVTQQKHKNTITGIVNAQNDTSNTASNQTITRLSEQRWNKSVTSIEALQIYLADNILTFPEFKGYCEFEYRRYPLL